MRVTHDFIMILICYLTLNVDGKFAEIMIFNYMKQPCKRHVQNKQLGFMLFFEGRKIGVQNAANVHWNLCYNLSCIADIVCQCGDAQPALFALILYT